MPLCGSGHVRQKTKEVQDSLMTKTVFFKYFFLDVFQCVLTYPERYVGVVAVEFEAFGVQQVSCWLPFLAPLS